ncbi:hypothetical protein C8J43_11626 [Sphingomonas sp. PP-CE-1G-424]|nr:hypothetical protein C8J43_11626 [Sphingomonas sp. PP-CE-1G-424]
MHRGIAVAEDDVGRVIAAIKDEGLSTGGQRRPVEVWPLAGPRMLLEGDVDSIDLRPGEARPAVYAADAYGAMHYACRPNRIAGGGVPLMIEFDAPSQEVCVDGNDLLYVMFSRIARIEVARSVLEACYGRAILDYAERAWATDDPMLRITLCDLAVWDPEVVAAHHANRLLIRGKSATLFRSAFKVMLPVAATAIVAVRRVEECPPEPRFDVSIEALTL